MRKAMKPVELIEPANRLVFLRPHVARSDKYFAWFLVLGAFYFVFQIGRWAATY